MAGNISGKTGVYLEVDTDLLKAYDMTLRAMYGPVHTRTDEIKKHMRVTVRQNRKKGSVYPEVEEYLKKKSGD